MSNHGKARAAAHRALDWGYGGFPLSINKIPIIRSPHEKGHTCPGMAFCGAPGHGVGDATDDHDVLDWLFDQAPKAVGYGIACGGRLVGLDLDRKNGVDGVATLNRLSREHGFPIPYTTTVGTPNNGLHLWGTIPEGTVVPNSVGRLGPGIDVRSSRGYLVGPGSVGRNGEYVFHPKTGYIEPQPIPEQLLALMLPPAPRPQPQRRLAAMSVDSSTRTLQGLVDVVLKSSQGNRNSALYWAASKAWAHARDGHIAAADAEAELVGAAIQVGLGEAEARRTVASAERGVRV
ncbi:bifunctional DNA primase/polymerase [Streptomyces sp. ME02-8801-2C]|uniref:bifunctional DNA primase/polymerase n=1 Tax=Streptomyces sp. ME02-8801-2C TaxID=3028680 RepID=UPI0029BAAA84|nr:bifunctional DNA primase/polymerase [Streptomyces sp. ME02-8801-2C]MDX3458427.1 bifunctional DNA primase/polymerase [Streptomyces sp. ME02-8801-2C]